MAFGSTQIAALHAKISLDAGDFNRGMKGVRDDLTFAEKGVKGFGQVAGTLLVAGLAVGTAAVGGLTTGLVKATHAAADMEQRVADIRSVFGSTAPAVEELNKAIMDLGLDPKLKISANEAADAIEALSKNGITWDEIMQGAARSTALLANATNDDFALAANIATDVMKQFNIDAGNMDSAINGIIGVTQQSKFGIEDYALALGQGGAVAASFGVELEDFNAVLSATSSNFFKGSDAGTSFKVFIQRLAPDTLPAKDAMRDLGIITAEAGNRFFDSSGNMKSMSDIADILQQATHNLSEEQKIQTLSTIFGTDAQRMAAGMARVGGEEITRLKGIIGNTSAEEAAATRMDTLRGAWEIFTGIVETLQIGIGQKFLPVARLFTEWASEMAGKYGPAVIEWASKLADQMMAVVEVFMAVVSGGTQFQEKFDALPGPIKAVVLGVTDFIKAVVAVFRPISEAIGKVVNWQDVLTALGILLLNSLYPILAAFVGFMTPIMVHVTAMIAVVALLRKAWESDWGNIRTDFEKLFKYLQETFGETYNAIKQFGGGALAEIVAFVSGNETSFENVRKIWATAKEALGKLKDDIINHLKLVAPQWTGAWAHMRDFFKGALEGIAQWLQKYTDSWKGDWSSTIAYFTGPQGGAALRMLFGNIQGWIKIMVSDALAKFTKWREGILNHWNDMKNDALANWGHIVNDTTNTIKHWIGDIEYKLDRWAEFFIVLWGNIRRNAQIIWNEIVDWTTKKWETWFGWFKPLEWLKAGTDIAQGLWDGVKTTWENFTKWWSGAWTTLRSKWEQFWDFGSPSKVMMRDGENIGTGLTMGIASTLPALNKAMDDMAGVVSAPSLLGEFTDAGTALGTAFGSGLTLSVEENLAALDKKVAAFKATVNFGAGSTSAGSTAPGGGATNFASGLNLGAIGDFLMSRGIGQFDNEALIDVINPLKSSVIELGKDIAALDPRLSDAKMADQLQAISRILFGVAETGMVNGAMYSSLESTLKEEIDFLVSTIRSMRANALGTVPTTPIPGVGGVGGTGTAPGSNGPHSAKWGLSDILGGSFADALSYFSNGAFNSQTVNSFFTQMGEFVRETLLLPFQGSLSGTQRDIIYDLSNQFGIGFDASGLPTMMRGQLEYYAQQFAAGHGDQVLGQFISTLDELVGFRQAAMNALPDHYAAQTGTTENYNYQFNVQGVQATGIYQQDVINLVSLLNQLYAT